MISQQTINDIFSTARVEEVISDFVQIKKSGSNYKALSPFSDEKTPSFMISPAKQIWKDFSSGKGGNVVSFLMELEQYSYPEALRYLAKKYNIEIVEDQYELSESQEEEKKLKEQLFQIHEVAKDYFEKQLWESEEGKNVGLSYFKERGFEDEVIRKFQLGYSPKQRDAFTQYALEKGYKKEILEASGLSIFKENYEADRFRERVMFPIFSNSGRCLGFGGRVLKSAEKTAKYINSPETEIYHKSQIVFGLFQAKKEIVKQDVCYLVEGYTDVVSLFQNGIENVVASSGTALTQEHIRLIKRFTTHIVLLFDGDSAGINASLRSIDMILKEGLSVKVVLFPEGEDPDSFSRTHSRAEITSFLNENATDFIQFKTELLLKDSNNDPIKKSEVIKDILKSIASVQDAIQREIYIQNTSKLLEISEHSLHRDLQQMLSSEARNERRQEREREKPIWVVQENAEPEIDPVYEAENKLMEILLKYGNSVLAKQKNEETIENTVIEEIIHHMEEDKLQFKTLFFQKMFEDIKLGYEQEELRTGDFFLTYTDEEITQYTAHTLFEKYQLSPNWKSKNIFIPPFEKDIQKEVEQSILHYKLLNVEDMIKTIAEPLKEETEDREEKMNKIIHLNQVRSQIKALLFRTI